MSELALAIGVFACAVLTIVTILLATLGFLAYRRTKKVRFLLIALAYLTFFLRSLWLLGVGLLTLAFPLPIEFLLLDFLIVLLFYLAVLK